MNVVITGACGGMGHAATKLLKEKGYNVYAGDLVLNNLVDGVKYQTLDVTNVDSCKNFFDFVKSECEDIYAIIHFAGIYDMNSLVEISEEDFIRIFNINVFGIYRLNKLFVSLLKKNSRVVITSSELAPLDPLPFTGLYGITKSTIEKYAYSLRMELNLLGIKVCLIRPGAVKTGLLGVSTSKLDKFVENTQLYKDNSLKFKHIVESVEAKNIEPIKIGKIAYKILKSKKPKYIYNINRNKLLRLLNFLPRNFQVWVIKKILK